VHVNTLNLLKSNNNIIKKC